MPQWAILVQISFFFERLPSPETIRRTRLDTVGNSKGPQAVWACSPSNRLEQISFGKTDHMWAGHDEAIDQAHVDKCEGFLHARGDWLVGLALVRDARRMIVVLMCP